MQNIEPVVELSKRDGGGAGIDSVAGVEDVVFGERTRTQPIGSSFCTP